MTDFPQRHRKSNRASVVHRPVIADEIVVAEFKKNRGGDSVRIMLRPYEGCNTLDIRTWHGGDGYRRPGKGFACDVARLPELAKAIVKAERAACDLGLIEGEGT